MGLDMLRGETSAVHDDSKNDSEQDDDQEDRVLVPFAMPLVAGPGSITTAITLSAASPGWDGILVTLGAVVLTVITLRFSLSFSSQIADRLGGRPLRLLTRFMGLILVAIGAQFLLAGFSGFLSSSIPNLAPHTELAQP